MRQNLFGCVDLGDEEARRVERPGPFIGTGPSGTT
jgi:hypothetical protein